MPLEEITLALFAACSNVRVVAYVPQILRAASDKNGASSISCTTWTLFLIAHVSTVACALINRADWGLAACFAGTAVCCVAIWQWCIASAGPTVGACRRPPPRWLKASRARRKPPS
jgi:hypothetical protein